MGAQNQNATGLPTIEAPSNWPPPTSGALNANSPVAGAEDGSAAGATVFVATVFVATVFVVTGSVATVSVATVFVVGLPVVVGLTLDEGEEPHPARVTLVSAIANPTLTSRVRKVLMAEVLQIIPWEPRAPSQSFAKVVLDGAAAARAAESSEQ